MGSLFFRFRKANTMQSSFGFFSTMPTTWRAVCSQSSVIMRSSQSPPKLQDTTQDWLTHPCRVFVGRYMVDDASSAFGLRHRSIALHRWSREGRTKSRSCKTGRLILWSSSFFWGGRDQQGLDLIIHEVLSIKGNDLKAS